MRGLAYIFEKSYDAAIKDYSSAIEMHADQYNRIMRAVAYIFRGGWGDNGRAKADLEKCDSNDEFVQELKKFED
jgi:hypothetical protein